MSRRRRMQDKGPKEKPDSPPVSFTHQDFYRDVPYGDAAALLKTYVATRSPASFLQVRETLLQDRDAYALHRAQFEDKTRSVMVLSYDLSQILPYLQGEIERDLHLKGLRTAPSIAGIQILANQVRSDARITMDLALICKEGNRSNRKPNSQDPKSLYEGVPLSVRELDMIIVATLNGNKAVDGYRRQEPIVTSVLAGHGFSTTPIEVSGPVKSRNRYDPYLGFGRGSFFGGSDYRSGSRLF